MALPDIAGYLASIRQPLDLVGPAIQAFQAVSSEMRATRAQNLAEEESARDLGKGIKEGMQDDRMFQENLIDTYQMRGLRDQEMQMEMARFAMDMKQQEFEYQNLLPLEVQSRQLGLARQQQVYDATAMEMQTEQYLRTVGVENLNRVGALMGGGLPVPEEAIDVNAGETAESPQARIRAASRQLDMIEPLLKSTGDPGLAVQYQNHRRILESDPDYQNLRAKDGLLLPAEKSARRDRRLTTFKAMLPWDDAGTAGFIERNWDSVTAMLEMPDTEFGMIWKRLLDRAEFEHKDQMSQLMPGSPREDYVGQRNRYDDLAKAKADVAAARAVFEAKQGSKTKLGLQEAEGQFRSAEARYNALVEAYGGMVPGIAAPAPAAPAVRGGTSIEDFYR
jgi:hypothetical protein